MTELAQGTAQIADIDALSAGIAIASVAKQTYAHLTIRPKVRYSEKETAEQSAPKEG